MSCISKRRCGLSLHLVITVPWEKARSTGSCLGLGPSLHSVPSSLLDGTIGDPDADVKLSPKLYCYSGHAQKVKDPGKAAELRAHLQRLDQQLAADAAAQRRAQLVSGIKVNWPDLQADRTLMCA